MMVKSAGYPGGYYRSTFETAGESEGSGSSGRIDTEITASEDSSAPARKCINLNSDKGETLGVPMQVISLSDMSPSERKDLINRLRLDLEQIRILQKKVELQRTNGVTVSCSSDILSCSNGQNASRVENIKNSSVMTAGPPKKVNPSSNGMRGWNRGSTGRFESAKQPPMSAGNMMLMKQCDTLLKRVMSHQYAWVFNSPVDVVKLNIPDYFTIIKHPMDLGTVKSKLASGAYSSPLEFVADVRLTFTNATAYNSPENDVHIMAVTLSKFFEVRWKTIEKKIPPAETKPLLPKLPRREDTEIAKSVPPAKKRKTTSLNHETPAEPVKRFMTAEEKHILGRELESLLGELPMHIIDFLREHSSSGRESRDDEIEIDIDDLSNDTLFALRKLLDDYIQQKQKNLSRAEPCEIELLNESGLSNSSMQHCKGNEPADEDVDIGGNEPPVSSYPSVEIEKDVDHRSSKCISAGSSSDSDPSSSDNESDGDKEESPANASKVPGAMDSGAQSDKKTSIDNPLDRNQSISGLDQLDQASQPKPSSVESDGRQDGDSAPSERQVSPEKQYRAALLKNRYADIILKSREKTLSQNDKGDPEKLRRKREELELQKKKEKARLQAEAKAAEDAQRRAEAEAAAEARKKRELEREAARQALAEMEKTVVVDENPRFLQDLEMLRTGPAEHLPSSVDETSPDNSQDGLGSFKFGASNPLEQLGLFMKDDEEEEEGEPHTTSDPVNDVEEGEID